MYAKDPRAVWYKTAQWKAMRAEAVRRSGWRCGKCKVFVVSRKGFKHHPREATVDHIEPHKFDRARFFCPVEGLQVLCKACHDAKTAGPERRGYELDIGNDGWPTDPRHPANAKA